jgi:hypothetical protein
MSRTFTVYSLPAFTGALCMSKLHQSSIDEKKTLTSTPALSYRDRPLFVVLQPKPGTAPPPAPAPKVCAAGGF